jgi:F-type H+-transporting ATPase subunit epsilon
MKTFVLNIYSAQANLTMDDVTNFVGIDASGSFGILADHERMMTILEFGFVTVRRRDHGVQYIAMPGAVLYFSENSLSLVTSRFIVSADDKELGRQLSGQIAAEEAKLYDLKESVRKMEESMLKQLYRQERERSLLI